MLAHQRLPAAFKYGVDANSQLVGIWRHFLIAGILIMQNVGFSAFPFGHHFMQAAYKGYAVRDGNATRGLQHQWTQETCRFTRAHPGADNNDALQLCGVCHNLISHPGGFKPFVSDV